LVLFGNNGDGKSSFTDAIEWFFCDDIDHLRPEGCGRDDYFNRALDPTKDARVSLAFTTSALDSNKVLRRRGGSEATNKTEEFTSFINKVNRERIILRHHTMREFIDKSKKEKLEDVEQIIGLGVVKQVRNELTRAKNALEDDRELAELKGQLTERERDLTPMLGGRTVSEEAIVALAEQLRLSLNWKQPITDQSSLQKIPEIAGKKQEDTDRETRLKRLDEVEKLIPSLSSISNAVETTRTIAHRHNEIIAQRATIEAAALGKLYEAATDVIAKQITKPDVCPLCGNKVNTHQLMDQLQADIVAIKKNLSAREKLLKDVKPHNNRLAALGEKFEEFSKAKTSDVFTDPSYTTVVVQANRFVGSMAQAMDIVSTKLDPIDAIIPSAEKWKPIEIAINNLISQIKTQRDALLGSEAERRIYENKTKILKLADTYLRYCEIKNAISTYDLQIASLKIIADEFDKVENKAITEVMNAISEDVNKYFTEYLHPDDKIEHVKLLPTEERGIEFQVQFHGEDVRPPRRVLSESHLNSLGICLFLASAKHFNQVSGFVILDDIVSSFDANHRRTLARLLRSEFPDMQVLLLTHDDLWFSHLKLDLPKKDWIFQEIGQWSYEKGIQLIPFSPMSLRDEIRWLLDNNRIDSAANKTRILIEASMKDLCVQLGVKELPFLIGPENDRREPSELIDALTSHLNSHKALPKSMVAQLADIKSDQLLTNIGSHHRTLETTGLKRGDIDLILKDLDAYNNLFICKDCKTQVSYKYSARSTKIKQCKCGKLLI
jgi:DNA repair exonuclease SbcCD ATPase subunit